MSVPPDMLARIGQQGKQPTQLPGAGTAGPAGAPMAKPGKKEGNEQQALLKVHIAMNMLESALPLYGSESKEGKAILKHLNGMAKDFGETDTSDIMPAEMKSMVDSIPQVGGGGPMMQKIMQMMKGGGAPGGAPPMPGAMPAPGGQPPMPGM